MTTQIAQSQDLRLYAQLALSVILPDALSVILAHEDSAGEVDYSIKGTSFRFCVGEYEGERQILIYEQGYPPDYDPDDPETHVEDVEIIAWFPLDKPIDFAEELATRVATQKITSMIETMREHEDDE